MKYDFDTVVSRVGFNSRKYDMCEKKFGTNDILPMWIADMDLQTAQPIIDELAKRVQHGIFGYTERPDSYFKAIADWQKKRNNWEVSTDLMSYTPNVVSALSVVVQTHSKVGDTVMIQTPVYPKFFDVVEKNDRKLVSNKLINDNCNYKIDFEDFEEKLKQGVAVFILCNPQNPVGKVWSYDELKKMGDLCVKYNTIIVSDEIHSDIMLWGNKHIPIASISDEISKITITCTSSSKTFNLAGLQCATTIFPTKEIKSIFDAYFEKLNIVDNNCFSVVANEIAFTQGEEWLDQVIEYIQDNITYTKNYIDENIPKIKAFIPESTYLMWLDFSAYGLSDEELNNILINNAKVGLNDCKPYCNSLSGYFRFNLACSRKIIEQALEQIKNAFENL